uniref:Uncharacterized protein n=1 Tax=Anguilla anguilla TaxID=7936 RepID=A0A0E9RSV2_ANGAN
MLLGRSSRSAIRLSTVLRMFSVSHAEIARRIFFFVLSGADETLYPILLANSAK